MKTLNRNTDSTGTDHTSRQAPVYLKTKDGKYVPRLGCRVKLNSNVAPAFQGQTGSVESTKPDTLNTGRTLYVVRLDTPTSPATNWSALETLAVPDYCLETLER